MLALLASSAFAAPLKHRAPVAHDTTNPYGQAEQHYLGRQSDVVMFGGHVVGEDPDPNIRSQMLHDPVPSEY
jgi:hypothetical protein